MLALRAPRAAALGPQATALPPFDLFHDLRWISVYHANWITFALEIGLMLAFRAAYAAWMVRAAWRSGPPPSFGPAFARALVFYAITSLLLVPWVVLIFGYAFTGLSWLFVVAIPPVLAIALVIHRGALSTASGRLWDWRPRWSSVGWVACSFIWLSVAGAVVSESPPILGLVAAALAGLLNARAALGITARISEPAPRRLLRWLVPVSLAGIFAGVLGGAALGFAGVKTPSQPPPSITLPKHGSARPVIVVSGFNSRSSRSQAFPLPRGFVQRRYSYAGIGSHRRFRPYGPGRTLQPVSLSARRLAREIRLLHATYGYRVSIVAESEGALVARYYLTQMYEPSSHLVRSVALLDMPPVDSGIYYPAGSARDGWGIASGWGLRGLTDLIESLGPLHVTADAGMLRPFAECPLRAHQVMTQPAPPGVHEISFLAIGDAMDGTAAVPAGVPAYVVLAHHGGLIKQKSVQQAIYDLLLGKPIASDVTRLDLVHAVSAMSNAWHEPSLLPGAGPARDC